MALEKVVKGTKDWALKPLTGGLEGLVSEASKKPEVRAVLGRQPWAASYLRDYLEEAYNHNWKLRRLAGGLDTANKALVPVDAALDYFNLMYGLGTAARGTLTALKLPGYLAYDTYYALKTGDVLGAIGDLAYEGVSWLAPGSLPHLISRYTHQSEKYIINEGVSKFLKAAKTAKAERTSKIPRPRVIELPAAA